MGSPTRHQAPSGASGVSSAPERKPTMTERQLGHSVISGRLVTFGRLGEQPIDGYLAGLDDENYLVLIPGDCTTYLLDRDASPWQKIHPHSTFTNEEKYRQLEAIVKPFREWVSSELLRLPPRSR